MGRWKWGAALALGSKIYGIPYDGDRLLLYNPATNAARGVDTSAVAVGKGKWGAALALGGKIYGIPCDAKRLLVYDPATDAVRVVDTAALVVRNGRGARLDRWWWSAAVALGGRIYGIPFNAKRLLVCDPAWAARRLLALASRKPQREVVCVTTETGAHGDESRAISQLGPELLGRVASFL